MAQLCEDWEAATSFAEHDGTRVVLARTGLVLAPSGGILGRIKPLFSLGLGARLGGGRQYMPWISLEDEVRALLFAISHDDVSGPVNLTGPAPVTNAEFTAALGRAEPSDRPAGAGFALRSSASCRRGPAGGQRAIRRRSSGPDSGSTTPSARRWPTSPPEGHVIRVPSNRW